MLTDLIYLVQTDTTVGFLSSNDGKLSAIKKRSEKQKILQVVDSFKRLKTKTRVPNSKKNSVRRSSLSTFIYPNGLSFRVVDKSSEHFKFIKRLGCLYSTSANITKKFFDIEYAIVNSDIVLYEKDGFKEKKASSIYKINNTKTKRIR